MEQDEEGEDVQLEEGELVTKVTMKTVRMKCRNESARVKELVE